MVFQFADIEIDTQRYEMRRGDKLVPVEPLVFDLLVHFASHPDQLFSYDELIGTVWAGRCVADSTVASAIKNARKVLGDSGNTQSYIKTVHGRGFRFNCTPQCIKEGEIVENHAEVAVELTPQQKLNSAVESIAQQQDENGQSQNENVATPSLLIIPFNKVRGHVELDEYVSGMVAELETVLTRVPLLELRSFIAMGEDRNSSDSQHSIGKLAGVNYALEGSAQVIDDCLRLNIHLTDVATGYRLWAELFESTLDPNGMPIKAMTNLIIAKLEPQLVKAMLLATQSDRGEPSARSLYIEASGILALKGWHQETFSEAIDLLRKSVALDNNFSLANGYLAFVLALGHRFDLVVNPEAVKEEAVAAAERALRLDNMDSTVLGYAGCALADLNYISRAKPILQNAVELAPANAQAWASLGAVCLLENETDKAVEYLLKSIKISPMDSRLSVWGAVLAWALFLCGDVKGALEQAELACQRDDRTYYPRIVLAALYLVQGSLIKARESMSEAYRIKPDLNPQLIKSFVGSELATELPKLVAK